MRCLALAHELRHRGWRTAFAGTSEAMTTVPDLAELVNDVLVLPHRSRSNPGPLTENWPEGCELLVVDHYGLDETFESACRPWASKILAIDDLADRPHDCDVLVDMTLGRTQNSYADWVSGGCKVLAGTGYVLLRPQFAALRDDTLSRRSMPHRVRRLFVTCGMTDPKNLNSKILRAISQTGLDVEVDVVVGPTSSHLDELRHQAHKMAQEVRLHVGTRAVAELIAAADLGIGSGGSTSWERCCLGLPTLLLVMIENQREVAHQLQMVGAVDLLGDSDSVGPGEIARRTIALANDTGRRHLMTQAAAVVCDGLGAKRTADVLAVERPVAVLH